MNKGMLLKPGSTIGLIAPGSAASMKNIEKGADILKTYGFNVVLGESLKHKRGYLSGTDELRARDINNMFKDKSIDGIICVRGGNGTGRLLNMIDYNIIKSNPKVFIGYSDITVLHIAFNQIGNLITFHGPMVASDIAAFDNEYSINSLLDIITTDSLGKILNNPVNDPMNKVIGGIAEGQIVGGNLAVLTSTMGTPYEIDTKGKILFIEDIDEEVYRIDRMLNQLRLAGKLQQCAGIILGEFLELNKIEDTLTLEEVIEDIIIPLKIPTISGVRCGHGPYKMTIPVGAQVKLDADNCTVTILENVLDQ